MTRVGLRFQRHHVDEGGKAWQQPKQVAQRLAGLGIKLKLQGHEEPLAPEALNGLGRDGLKAAGLDWTDTWRLLDDMAIEGNRDQVIDLDPGSDLVKAMAATDGVDKNYGSPLLRGTEQGPTLPQGQRIDQRQNAIRTGLNAALSAPPPAVGANEATPSSAERAADFLFVSRQASVQYILAEKGRGGLVDLIADTLPEVDSDRCEVIADEIVTKLEAKLASPRTDEALSSQWRWLATMRTNVQSLDTQDAIIELVETCLRGGSPGWGVRDLAEGLSMAELGVAERNLLIEAVAREPGLVSAVADIPPKLTQLAPDVRKAVIEILRPQLNGDGDVKVQKQVLAVWKSIPNETSIPVVKALLAWAPKSDGGGYYGSSLTEAAGGLDKMVASLPPVQWRPLLEILQRPEMSRQRALVSFAKTVGDESVLAVAPETRRAILEVGIKKAADDSEYNPFNGVTETAQVLVAMQQAGRPAPWIDLTRDILLNDPVNGVEATVKAEAPLAQLSPAVQEALAKSEVGRRAIQLLLSLPPVWGNSDLETNPVIYPPSADPAADRVRSWFLLDGHAGQAAGLIRGELTVPDHDDRDLVRLGQRMLSLAGFPLGADGVYGALTRGAIEAFQKSRGLPVNAELNGPTLALLAAEVGTPSLRTSSLGVASDIGSASGGPWRPTTSWSDTHRTGLARFCEAYRMAHGKAGEPLDGGANAAHVLVAYARQHGLPLGPDQTGGRSRVLIHDQSDPLGAAKRELQPVSDERAAKTWQAYWDNYKGTKGKTKNCLDTFDMGVRTLFRGSRLPPRLGDSVDIAVANLRRAGYADATVKVEFADKTGRKTSGVTAPVGLLEGNSVAGEAAKMAGLVPGWHFFGYSLLDGDHSIMVIVDNRDPADPKFFWGDQWSQSRGWKPLTAETFDARVVENTVDFWTSAATRVTKPVKFKTQSRITRFLVPG